MFKTNDESNIGGKLAGKQSIHSINTYRHITGHVPREDGHILMYVTDKRFIDETGLALPAIYVHEFTDGQNSSRALLLLLDIGGTFDLSLPSLDIGGEQATTWIPIPRL